MLQAAALAPVVETGESEDVWTRVRLHCDSTGLSFAELRYGAVVHTRENSVKPWAQFRPNPLRFVRLVSGVEVVSLFFAKVVFFGGGGYT